MSLLKNLSRFKYVTTTHGGQGGIRTPDTLASMPHFECGAFNRSATCPRGSDHTVRLPEPQGNLNVRQRAIPPRFSCLSLVVGPAEFRRRPLPFQHRSRMAD